MTNVVFFCRFMLQFTSTSAAPSETAVACVCGRTGSSSAAGAAAKAVAPWGSTALRSPPTPAAGSTSPPGTSSAPTHESLRSVRSITRVKRLKFPSERMFIREVGDVKLRKKKKRKRDCKAGKENTVKLRVRRPKKRSAWKVQSDLLQGRSYVKLPFLCERIQLLSSTYTRK